MEDSGEGRWTVEDSIDKRIPMPVITTSQFERFSPGTSFLSESPEAYERLILDAMRGDATLFTRDDEVEAQWRIGDPARGRLAGPEEADRLVREGEQWWPI